MLMSLFSIEGIGEEVILSVFTLVTTLVLFGYYILMRFVGLKCDEFLCEVCDMYCHFYI